MVITNLEVALGTSIWDGCPLLRKRVYILLLVLVFELMLAMITSFNLGEMFTKKIVF